MFGDDMNPTVVFRGSRMPELPNGKLNAAKKIFIDRELPEIKNLEDWTNNFNQGRGAESAYYQRAVDIGSLLKGRVDTSGHSLGGGLASAASMTSGKSGWTFNAAGLNSGTVEKYGGSLVGREDIINAYRVKGEVLTRLQEVDPGKILSTLMATLRYWPRRKNYRRICRMPLVLNTRLMAVWAIWVTDMASNK